MNKMTDAEILTSVLLLLSMSLEKKGISYDSYVLIFALIQQEAERLEIDHIMSEHLENFAPVASKLSMQLDLFPPKPEEIN